MPDTLAALSMLVIEVLSNLVVLDTASALGVAVNKGATQNSPPVRSRRKKIQKKTCFATVSQSYQRIQ
jgi:hypothetical protein